MTQPVNVLASNPFHTNDEKGIVKAFRTMKAEDIRGLMVSAMEAAKEPTLKQLKEELTARGQSFSPKAKRADLISLFVACTYDDNYDHVMRPVFVKYLTQHNAEFDATAPIGNLRAMAQNIKAQQKNKPANDETSAAGNTPQGGNTMFTPDQVKKEIADALMLQQQSHDVAMQQMQNMMLQMQQQMQAMMQAQAQPAPVVVTPTPAPVSVPAPAATPAPVDNSAEVAQLEAADSNLQTEFQQLLGSLSKATGKEYDAIKARIGEVLASRKGIQTKIAELTAGGLRTSATIVRTGTTIVDVARNATVGIVNGIADTANSVINGVADGMDAAANMLDGKGNTAQQN